MLKLLNRISYLGIVQGDNEEEIIQKRFLVFEAIFMSCGGILWGVLCLIYNREWQSLDPLGYTFLTIMNMIYFRFSKNFGIVKAFQTGISLLLPFIFQWVLGGFWASGAVMLWALLALAAALTYQSARSVIWWLLMYVGLTIFSGVFDPVFKDWIQPTDITDSTSVLFFVINISVISCIMFGLVLFVVTRKDKLVEKVKSAQSALVKSERMAALGQLVAGIAHEVNTPLGAIKSSAEELNITHDKILLEGLILLRRLPDEALAAALTIIQQANPTPGLLSSREERQLRKQLTEQLKTQGLEDARYHAGKLVQAGITEVTPPLIALIEEGGGSGVETTYSMILQKRRTNNIQLAVDKATRVVKALKNYIHRGDSEKMEITNLRENLETVLVIYHNMLKHGIEVVKEFEEVPDIPAFVDQLNQVWTNLIHNSIHAMNYKGVLTIGLRDAGDSVEVFIQDNGKGMSQEVQRKIFDPFFTTKPLGEGTGLGLDIVSQIVERHHGSIRVESSVGEGATFFIKLPKQQKESVER